MSNTFFSVTMIALAVVFSTAALGQDDFQDAAQESSSQDLVRLLSSEDVFPLSLRPRWDDKHPWIVEGQVRSGDGTPLQNCDLALIVQLHTMDSPTNPPIVVAESRSDEAGMFRIVAPSLEWYQCPFLHLIAKSEGHAVAVRQLELATKSHQELSITLDSPQPVQGSLLDPDGKPLANVKLRFERLSSADNGTVRLDTVGKRPAAWPADVITDANGKFVLDFISRQQTSMIGLVTNDQKLSPATHFVRPYDAANPEIALTFEPARMVCGRVVCQDTGEPMANTWMIVVSLQNNFSRGADQQSQGVEVRTDAQGFFKARVRPGKFITTYVYPSDEQPYPAWMEMQKLLENPGEPLKPVEVPRGVLVEGKVIDESTGEPVVGAGVEYIPGFDFRNPKYPGIRNPYFDQNTVHQVYWATERHRSLSGEQGRYQIAVLPGKGHLMVKAPTPEFVSRAVSRGELQWGRPVSGYYCVEGLRGFDLRPSQTSVEMNLVLQKGREVMGTLSGPNGEKIDKAMLLATTHSALWINSPNFRPESILDGRWKVSGLDSAFKPQRVSFFDPEHQWGTTVELPQYGRDAADYDLRLRPCGSATVKLVDQDNKPWANAPYIGGSQPLGIMLIEGIAATPVDGHFLYSSPGSIHWLMEEVAPSEYRSLKTNEQGEIVFPCLIPGAQYVFYTFNAGHERQFFKERKAFRIEPGENINLGTLVTRRQE